MSPAGITDVEKYGGTIFENMNLSRSLTMRGISPLFKSKYTLQDISQTFLIKNIINSQLKKRYDLFKEENDIMGEIIEIRSNI